MVDVIVNQLHAVSGTLSELVLMSNVCRADKGEAPRPVLAWPALRRLSVSPAVLHIMIAGHAAEHNWAMPNLRSLHVESIVSDASQSSDLHLPLFPVLPSVTKVTFCKLSVPQAHLAHLATTSPHLIHLAIRKCTFDEVQALSSPVQFSVLTKLVVDNHHVEEVATNIAVPQLELLVLNVITDDPVSTIPWPTITSLVILTTEEELVVSNVALDALPNLTALELPPVPIEWIDWSLPNLRGITDLTAPMQVLFEVDPPNVLRVTTPWEHENEYALTIPKNARHVKVDRIHIDVLEELAMRDNIETVTADEIEGRRSDYTDVLVFPYCQGHPVWRTLLTTDVWSEGKLATQLRIHVLRVDNMRMAVDELAKGIAVIAGVGVKVTRDVVSQVDMDEVEEVEPVLQSKPASPYRVEVILMDTVSLRLREPVEAMMAALRPQGILGSIWDWCDYY
ncbi:hypothetical protein GGF32_002231 [Allomyces javanicus]|nr:hypothetical protein GGF32_002231 [Allomyces javanicus]